MTQEELDKIPEIKTVRVLLADKDIPFKVWDSNNKAWQIGWDNGVLVKRPWNVMTIFV